MMTDHQARGGAAVGVLNRMETWEANLVLNLRLWCTGPLGQAQVWKDYHAVFPEDVAREECQMFERLLLALIDNARRPLVRHDVACSCVGADECVFLHLIRCASEGHLDDAALMAALLVGPATAEHIAIMAGQVGTCARKLQTKPTDVRSDVAQNVVRIH